MDDFLEIRSVYSSQEYRTVKDLEKFYTDDRLYHVIYELISSRLNDFDPIKDKKILLKPNWVRHSISIDDDICLRTHNDFLLTLVKVILKFCPKQITIGDAPIQGCKWDLVVDESLAASIHQLVLDYGIPIYVKDFRRVVLDEENNTLVQETQPISEYLIFDLKHHSYLDQVSTKVNNFRVVHYNHIQLGELHKKGVHKYCVTKELFDADIIISIPKLKTHQKTGMTGALKNLVGLNGDKDYLPHHRSGGTALGGDCYPGKNLLRSLSEKLTDIANKNIGKKKFQLFNLLSVLLWKISKPQKIHQMGAGWYGNDTCWRMVLDLNKIAIYGGKDGSLSETPQRKLYSLCDGIIGGQGNGPLQPIPLALGLITFSNNSAINDVCVTKLMGFEIQKISLINSAYKQVENKKIDIRYNSNPITLDELSRFSIDTLPPPGWDDYLNN